MKKLMLSILILVSCVGGLGASALSNTHSATGSTHKVILAPGISLDLTTSFNADARADGTFGSIENYISSSVDPNIKRGFGDSDHPGDYLAFSYSETDSYVGIDTWQSLETAATQFEDQFETWKDDYPGASFDVVAHSLGGVVVAYWLGSGKANSDDIAHIHSVLALSSPLRGARLVQHAFCALLPTTSGPLAETVLHDFCDSDQENKTVAGLTKVPFLILNNADDVMTNGCLLLGATTGNSGAWASAEPRMGPIPVVGGAPGCIAEGAAALGAAISDKDLAPIVSYLASKVPDNHGQTLTQEDRYGPWVRRALEDSFYNDTSGEISYSGGWTN